MAGRTTIIAELLQDYVEERVRQFPTQSFDLDAVKRTLREPLREAQAGFDLGPGHDREIAAFLDQHPFLMRAGKGPAPSWKPGLRKGAAKGRS